MIWLGGLASNAREGYEKALKTLDDGSAYAMFEKICQAQGGSLSKLPLPQARLDVLATQDGFMSAINTEQVGYAALALGAGRMKSSDELDLTSGIEIHKKLGDKVSKGETLYTLFVRDSSLASKFDDAKNRLLSATTISLQKPTVAALIAKTKIN
jgi:pyrimidine-nucleoside phosphorylase